MTHQHERFRITSCRITSVRLGFVVHCPQCGAGPYRGRQTVQLTPLGAYHIEVGACADCGAVVTVDGEVEQPSVELPPPV